MVLWTKLQLLILLLKALSTWYDLSVFPRFHLKTLHSCYIGLLSGPQITQLFSTLGHCWFLHQAASFSFLMSLTLSFEVAPSLPITLYPQSLLFSQSSNHHKKSYYYLLIYLLVVCLALLKNVNTMRVEIMSVSLLFFQCLKLYL